MHALSLTRTFATCMPKNRHVASLKGMVHVCALKVLFRSNVKKVLFLPIRLILLSFHNQLDVAIITVSSLGIMSVKISEPDREKTYSHLSMTKENSNQPAYSHSLIRECSLSTWRQVASLLLQNAHSEDSDQTARMRRLIWIFAGRTCL